MEAAKVLHIKLRMACPGHYVVLQGVADSGSDGVFERWGNASSSKLDAKLLYHLGECIVPTWRGATARVGERFKEAVQKFQSDMGGAEDLMWRWDPLEMEFEDSGALHMAYRLLDTLVLLVEKGEIAKARDAC